MPLCESIGFYNCGKLKDVEIVNMQSLSVLEFVLCGSIENVTCVNDLPKGQIKFQYSSNLTLESLTSIITHLPDLSGETSKTLSLHSQAKARLTEELIAQATNKNWIIA